MDTDNQKTDVDNEIRSALSLTNNDYDHLQELVSCIQQGDAEAAIPMLVQFTEMVKAKFHVAADVAAKVIEQRDKAIEEHEALKTALEEIDTDNNDLVRDVWEDGYQAGLETDADDSYVDDFMYDDVYDDAHSSITDDIREAVGKTLGSDPNSKEVVGFVEAMMDPFGLENDEAAQKTLLTLYQTVSGKLDE